VGSLSVLDFKRVKKEKKKTKSLEVK
jgi:hypothetical protein